MFRKEKKYFIRNVVCNDRKNWLTLKILREGLMKTKQFSYNLLGEKVGSIPEDNDKTKRSRPH